MGLDLVELVMEVEETFGFTIPDEDAFSLDTAGKLHDYILTHRFQGRQEGCLTSVAFYKLRRALTSVLGMTKRDVRVSVELATIIPTHRRRTWDDLQKSLELRLPKLHRPAWVKALAILVSIAIIIAAGVFFHPKLGDNATALLVIGTGCLASYILYQATKPLAVLFPSDCSTVASLTKDILQKNYGAISDACNRANADEVWETLRTVIVEQLGVRRADVMKETNFVKDLGAG